MSHIQEVANATAANLQRQKEKVITDNLERLGVTLKEALAGRVNCSISPAPHYVERLFLDGKPFINFYKPESAGGKDLTFSATIKYEVFL